MEMRQEASSAMLRIIQWKHQLKFRLNQPEKMTRDEAHRGRKTKALIHNEVNKEIHENKIDRDQNVKQISKSSDANSE